MYLTLKDHDSIIKSVMFRSNYSLIPFKINKGMEVIARGRVSLYAPGGTYQFYIQELLPQGIGAFELAFQQLKDALAAEGLFRKEHKKPIPQFPQSIGVITSPKGAVIRDFVKVVRRRFPQVNIFLVPTAVQGTEAPAQICNSINLFNNKFPVDVIVLMRGGGSLEELWTFNTEVVARAIHNSHIPIISAVGHETDVTISDMVADLRASTPSVAGEIVVPSIEELKDVIKKLEKQMYYQGQSLIKFNSSKLENIKKDLLSAINSVFERKERNLAILADKLHDLSPLQILKRGYCLCMDEKNNTIINVNQVKIGSRVKVILKKGILNCRVENKGEDLNGQKF